MKARHDRLTETEIARLEIAFADVSPRVLPAGWRRLSDYANAAFYESIDGIRVIAEAELHGSDVWLHVSLSRANRDPSYADMQRVKRLFVGAERKAVQVFPPEAEHYNFHPHCLHLWAPLGHDPLPNFLREDGQL